jgi:hypothetical protein
MTKEYFKTLMAEFLDIIIGKTDKEILAICKDMSIKRIAQRKATQYGKRNVNNPNNHWDNMDLSSYPNDKPIVICLSGNGASHPSQANGFCKITEGLLELLFKKNKNTNTNPEDYVDVIGCAYGADEEYLYMPNNPALRALYKTPTLYSMDFPEAKKMVYRPSDMSLEECEYMAESLLLPRCLDSSGNRLDLEECCRRMAGVTFFSFCYGAEVLNNIIDSLDKKLLMHGYNKEDIDHIHASMFHLSYARKDYTRKIPTAFFYSANDYDIGYMDKLANYMKKYNIPLKYRYTKTGAKNMGQEMYPESFSTHTNSESLEFAYWGTETDEEEWFLQGIDHYVSNMARDTDWDIIYKENEMYDPISQMMSWALCRAVENSIANSQSTKYIPKASMRELES